MRPCPECDSTDRHQETDRYALLNVGDGAAAARARPKLENGAAQVIVTAALICRNCGYVALFTKPE